MCLQMLGFHLSSIDGVLLTRDPLRYCWVLKDYESEASRPARHPVERNECLQHLQNYQHGL